MVIVFSISWSYPSLSCKPGQSMIVNLPSYLSHQSKLSIISSFFVTDCSLSIERNISLFFLGSDPVRRWQKVLLPQPVPPIMHNIGSL